MADAASDQERNPRAAESRERSGERESAGAALSGILLRQPERVDGEVGSAQTQEEEADKKHRERARAEVEDLAKGERYKHHHEGKE